MSAIYDFVLHYNNLSLRLRQLTGKKFKGPASYSSVLAITGEGIDIESLFMLRKYLKRYQIFLDFYLSENHQTNEIVSNILFCGKHNNVLKVVLSLLKPSSTKLADQRVLNEETLNSMF